MTIGIQTLDSGLVPMTHIIEIQTSGPYGTYVGGYICVSSWCLLVIINLLYFITRTTSSFLCVITPTP
jgi:hypothetical protein